MWELQDMETGGQNRTEDENRSEEQKERRSSTDSLPGFLEHMTYGLVDGACRIFGVG